MIPILFDSNERTFESNGLGLLSDASECKVTEERNGTYELTLKYPKNGVHYEDIEVNRIIFAIPSPYRDAEPFRIYKITKPMRGVITVYAQHISYDLSGITVNPFRANSLADVFSKIVPNSVNENPFTFIGSSTGPHEFNYTKPNSARQILGGMEGSIIDTYHGELEFNRFNVRWSENRGTNSGVNIRYGKNLLSVSQNVDISGIITGVVPYWTDIDGTNVVYGSRVDMVGATNMTHVVPLDLSQYFETEPTVEQLNNRAASYIKANYSIEPDISCEVSFAIIEQSEEYKEFRLLEKCDICDTVNVSYPELGVDSTAKITKIETDVLREKYNKVTIGSLHANLANTIVAQQKQVEEIPTKAGIGVLVTDRLSGILGANGGSVRLLDTNEDGEMDTLYIADDPNPQTAKKVWRFNYLGWAASSNGYNGPFTLGATLEDGLLADFVTAANLVAGTIKSKDNGNTFFLDLDNGILRMNASQFTISGSSISSVVDDAVDSATSGFDSRLSKAESTLQVQAGQIASKVSQGDLQSAIIQNASSIRLNASEISWESAGSTLTEDGVFTSRSAWSDSNWLRIENGEIFGGQGSRQYGEIDVSSTVGGKTGITLSGQLIYLDAETQVNGDLGVASDLNVNGTIYVSDISSDGYSGITQDVQFVDDITFDGETYDWTHKSFKIVNGIIVDVYVS